MSSNFIITIPSEVLIALKPKELAIYCSMRSFAGNGKGVCFAAADEIATRAKVSRPTVYKVQKKLDKLGFAKLIARRVRRVGGKPVSHFSIVDLLKPEEQVKTEYLPVSKNENFSKSKRDTQKAEKESIKESRASVEEKPTLVREKAWNTYAEPIFILLGILDPYVKEAARQAFLKKAKSPTKASVEAFIKKQAELTPPGDYIDFAKDFPSLEKNKTDNLSDLPKQEAIQ